MSGYADLTLCRKGRHHLNWPHGRSWGGRCRGCRQLSQNRNNFNRWKRDLGHRLVSKEVRLTDLLADARALGIPDRIIAQMARRP